jgi:hypothetical protein
MKLLNLDHNYKHYLSVLLSALAILALFLLSSSLNNLEIGPGERFIIPLQQEVVPEITGTFQLDGEAFLTILLYIALTLVLVSLVVVILSAENRKRAATLIGKNLLVMAGFMLLLSLFSTLHNPEELVDEDTTPAGNFLVIQPPGNIDEQEPAKPVEYTPPTQPSGLFFIITLLLILVLGVAGYHAWQSYHSPKQQLHEIARKTLDDLAASGSHDWQDIVIRCYADMSSVVSKKMDLHRSKSMTPAEFSAHLEKAGLPSKPVHNLTHLFEKARYGSQHSSSADIREAMTCLSAILQVVERRT